MAFHAVVMALTVGRNERGAWKFIQVAANSRCRAQEIAVDSIWSHKAVELGGHHCFAWSKMTAL